MKFCNAASLLVLAMFAVPATAQDVPLRQPGTWAQDYAHQPADPAIRFGTLPNGLRYAIMHNETPKDGIAMRMRLGSGSLVETDDQQGLAHFLEHMAFRGSTNVKDGEVVHMLERQGLRFGADTNAFTAQDQTVFMFNFPTSDASAIDTGLTLFREIGSRLNLAPAAVDAERGVILSEERLRDTPPYEAQTRDLDNVLAGTRAAIRWPIGLVSTIKAATPERLRSYYEAHYRPDNATIIVVGNVDPAKIEADIKARFGGWKAKGKIGALPNPLLTVGKPSPAHPTAEYVATGVPDQLALEWAHPVDLRAETVSVDHQELVQMIGLTVLNDQLGDLAAKPGAPFLGAQAMTDTSLLSTASFTQISVHGAPEKWREALDTVTQTLRRLLQQGVSPDDLQRALAQMRTQFAAAAASAVTRKDGDLADELVSTANDDRVDTSPAQDLAFATPIFDHVTRAEVNDELRASFAGPGPVLFRSAQKSPVGAAILAQALASAETAPVSAQSAEAAVVWPYTDFGTMGAVVSRVDDAQLGATIVSFANGARLIVKPTSYNKDRISIAADFGEGRKAAAPALVHALWAASDMPIGGTGKLSYGDISRWVDSTGRLMSVHLTAATGAFQLAAGTRPADFLSQMQVLNAFARDPGFRPELGDKMAAIKPMLPSQIDANAGAVFAREAERLMTGGDQRYVSIPTAQNIAKTQPSDLVALLRPALAGPADVTIVGDISVDAAIKAMAATFGAGKLASYLAQKQVPVTMPQGRDAPWIVTHKGRADQAYYGEFWSLPDYFADPHLSHVGDVAAAILGSRLVDTVREKMGITYSPHVGASSSLQLVGDGYFDAVIETPRANFERFRALLASENGNLASQPVSADELSRAKKPLIDASDKALETNDFWLSHLQLFLRDPRMKAEILDEAAGIKNVNAADVESFFRQHVAGRTPVTIISEAP